MADDDAELQEFRQWKKDRDEKRRKNAKVRVFEIPAELAGELLGRGGDEGDEGDEGGDEGGKGGRGWFGDR